MTQFSDFALAAPIEKALAAEGYVTPTPIQAKAIPVVMGGSDLLGIAQTGTGKTAAFALPLLHRLASNPRPRKARSCRALILSPTRELASQIGESCKAYGRHLRLSISVVFGGVSLFQQEKMLSGGVDIIVATPGRLLDLIDRRAVTIGDIEVLVLDEADQMLDLGFIHALRRIVKLVPKERQSLFFSATMPQSIAELAGAFLSNPQRVEVAPVATTAERVDQHVIFVSSGRKQALLAAILEDQAITRTLVFTRTKHGADKVVKALDKSGISAAAIHGNKSQSQRERALHDFKTGRCRVMVATDIAARGIDIDAVSHVFNYDLPHVPEQYVHRIGRTARAGAAGIAIAFCNGEDRPLLRDIEKLIRQKVPVMSAPAGFDVGQDNVAAEAPRKPNAGHRQQRPAHGGARHGAAGHHGSRHGGRRFNDERPQGEGRDRPQTSHGKAGHGHGAHGGERKATSWQPELNRPEPRFDKPREAGHRNERAHGARRADEQRGGAGGIGWVKNTAGRSRQGRSSGR